MTPAEFNCLPLQRQKEIFDNTISPIAAQRETEITVILKRFEDFYIEMYYWNKKGQLVKYEAFDELERLKPYLKGEDISKLFKPAPTKRNYH